MVKQWVECGRGEGGDITDFNDFYVFVLKRVSNLIDLAIAIGFLVTHLLLLKITSQQALLQA